MQYLVQAVLCVVEEAIETDATPWPDRLTDLLQLSRMLVRNDGKISFVLRRLVDQPELDRSVERLLDPSDEAIVCFDRLDQGFNVRGLCHDPPGFTRSVRQLPNCITLDDLPIVIEELQYVDACEVVCDESTSVLGEVGRIYLDGNNRFGTVNATAEGIRLVNFEA